MQGSIPIRAVLIYLFLAFFLYFVFKNVCFNGTRIVGVGEGGRGGVKSSVGLAPK